MTGIVSVVDLISVGHVQGCVQMYGSWCYMRVYDVCMQFFYIVGIMGLLLFDYLLILTW